MIAAALCGCVAVAPAAMAKQPKLVSASQKTILKKGIAVRLPGRGASKVQVTSSTFDEADAGALTKKRRFRPGHPKVVRLKLTRAGKADVRSCEARTLIVRASGSEGRKQLARTTPTCAPKSIDLSRAAECDWIGQQDGSRCMFPFPSDFQTTADPSSATGRRIAFQAGAMPRNTLNTPINPVDYNRRDGFSPGATILLKVDGLDSAAAMQRTGAVPINHIGRYADPDQPIVVIDADTGQRQPIWAEVDANATSPADTAIEIHPATNFASGHRYIVAMRNLKRADGTPISTPEGFRYYRDALPSGESLINGRRAHFEELFETLRDAGIRRSDLYLAWDFTVATDEDTARQMLHMRDDAFGVLGDEDMGDLTVDGDSPAFSVSSVQDIPDGTGPGQDPNIARRVKGTFTVPCYLFPNCAAGGRFQLDSNGLPMRNGDWQANFDCIIPRSAIEGGSPTPGKAATYGHGLFGTASQVYGSEPQRILAEQYGYVFCATDEIGMASDDVPGVAATILPDLSNFPRLADRLHQGLLNGLFLGRLMLHEDGLLSDAAFHVDENDDGSAPVIDTSELYYVGASQGGIFGGALTAIAPDFTRAVLNVPAMNYSVLLPRSVDYDEFGGILNTVYTDELQRPLLLALIQMLWDRSEPNGYAHRMTTNPLPETPAHTVLMNVAFGDHQVTNFQADVEARTIGARVHTPVLYPGRWPDVDIAWNVPAIDSYPYDGSAIVYGDIGPERANASPPPSQIGVSPPPLTNTPNRSGEDPHGAPRGAPLALQLIADFLNPTGAITNPCGPSPCYAGDFTGP